MSQSQLSTLVDFVQHRISSAQFLDELGSTWQADESGCFFEASDLPRLEHTISIQPEDVANTLNLACAGELGRPELRLWASIILLTDYFSMGDAHTAQAREAAIEALHWLASSDGDPGNLLREAQRLRSRLVL
jgi:hypothetical protein